MLLALAVRAIAGLLAAQAPPAAAGEVRIDAAKGTCEAETDVCRLEGDVILRRGVVTVRAPEALYDRRAGTLDVSGGVLLTDPTRAIAGRTARVILGGRVVAEDVVAVVKDRPTALGEAKTFEEARRIGGNRITVHGRRLETGPDGRLLLDGARLTLCDCPGGGAPSWEIQARRADVIPGQRAILTWPVFRITPRFLTWPILAMTSRFHLAEKPVPILALPWLYVPLGERQSGFLLPTFSNTGTTGLLLSEPAFLTLGESADATLTGEYAFGPNRAPTPAEHAIRGPGASLEVRWAPAVAAAGRVEIRWLDNLIGGQGDASGNRIAIHGVHAQRISEDLALRVDLRLFDDPFYVRDFSSDLLLRAADYARSDVLLSYRAGNAVVELGAAYHDPLAVNGPGGFPIPPPGPYGAFGARVPVFQRWPSLTFDLTPLSLGPLLLSGRAGLSRYAPLEGFENASAGGLVDLAPFDRRLAANRADARAEITAPLLLGRVLLFEPYLRGAALGYLFDARLDPIVNAWGVAGAHLSSEISRSFGAVRHALIPFVELRAGTGVAGEHLPVPSYDLWDRGFGRPAIRLPGSPGSPTSPTAVLPFGALPLGVLPPGPTLAAAPPGPFEQLRAGIETRLTRGSMDLLRLAVGQDVDLSAGRLAETWATGTLLFGPLMLDALARFYADGGRPDGLVFWTTPGSWLDRLTAFRAGATVTDHRGDSVHAGILSLSGGASPEAAAGIDALFDQRQVDITPVAQANAGARVVLGPATVSYDIFFPGRPLAAPICPGGGTGAFTVQQQTATFVWNSPCRCFRASLAIGMRCDSFSFSAGLSLSGTGSFR